MVSYQYLLLPPFPVSSWNTKKIGENEENMHMHEHTYIH